MKSCSPWAFGLVAIIIFLFLAFHNFEPVVFLNGETKQVKGKIFETRAGYMPEGFNQHLFYAYSIDEFTYGGHKTISSRVDWQHVGNEVLIEYEIENPANHKIIGYYNNFWQDNLQKYYSTTKIGYNKLELNNQMFYLTEYTDSGLVINYYYGDVKKTKDTLFASLYPHNIQSLIKKRFVFVQLSDSLKNNYYLEFSTNNKYKSFNK